MLLTAAPASRGFASEAASKHWEKGEPEEYFHYDSDF